MACFTYQFRTLDLLTALPYIKIGNETKGELGRPRLNKGMKRNLLMYIPNFKNPKKDLWLIFSSHEHME